MKLPDMNVEHDDNMDELAVPAGRAGRAPVDREPKKSVAQAQRAAVVADLVRAARANGDSLTGPTGLLKQVTAMVLEAALEEEMTEHLGHSKHRANTTSDRDSDDIAGWHNDIDVERNRNVRNGSRDEDGPDR